MADNRIRGQETTVYVISGGQTQQFSDVKSFSFEFDIMKLEEKYLGQVSNQFDEMFNGLSGKIDIHLDGPTGIDFAIAIKDRAQRRVPTFTVNVQTTLSFPVSGQRVVLFPNVFFSNFPFNFPDRTSYVDLSLNWACQSIQKVV